MIVYNAREYSPGPQICTLCDNFLAGNTWDAGIPALTPDERLTKSQAAVGSKSRGVVDENGEEGVPQNAKWCVE